MPREGLNNGTATVQVVAGQHRDLGEPLAYVRAMEIRLRLDDELGAQLDEEARLQGFDDRGAYLRWIVANRPMSDLATTQAPAVASRVSELEERVKLLERQHDFDDPADPDADLGQPGGTGTVAETETATANTGETGLESRAASESDAAGESASLDSDIEPDQETMGPDSEDEDMDEGEGAAADDDIAEAIGGVSLDEEDESGDE
ncbi:hypothetical protein [Halorientalis sp.]|uniref:hypothetical protein n=1 Tax=Halorientalis sp. TaxID=1931229 RepID=UPI00262FB211|nr:hypothetical protein [Halorientalis sp.]